MTRRPGFVVDHFVSADGGVPPNQFHPVVSAQVRCNWPPLATKAEVRQTLEQVYLKALAELDRMRPSS